MIELIYRLSKSDTQPGQNDEQKRSISTGHMSCFVTVEARQMLSCVRYAGAWGRMWHFNGRGKRAILD